MEETCRNCYMELDCGQLEYCCAECREAYEKALREITEVETAEQGD